MRRLVIADKNGKLAGVVTQGDLLPIDPIELYEVLELLQDQVSQLQSENAELLQQRNQELETLFEQKASELQRRDEMLHNLVLGIGVETGEGFWRSLTAYLTEALQIDYAFVGKLTDNEQRVRTLAVHGADEKALPNFDYELKGALCEHVIAKQTCLYRQGVWRQFHNDQMQQAPQIENYLGAPLQNSEGQSIGLLVVLSHEPMANTDFMEEVLGIFATRAASELDRQKAEVEQQSFFSLSLDPICIASTEDGHFKKFNPALERILGYLTTELLSKPFLDFVHPEDKAATQSAIAQLRVEGSIPAFENRYRAQDGSYRWFLWASTAVPEQQLIYATARDITERKQIEESLRIKTKQQATVVELGQLARYSQIWCTRQN